MSRCHLFSKYHVLIYPDCAGACKALRLRRIVPRILCVAMLAMIVSGGVLVHRIMDIQVKQQAYAHSESERIRLRSSILAEASELAQLRDEYLRVDGFNRKLKVMLNMDEAGADSAFAQGGAGLSFVRGAVTPYSMRSLVRSMQQGVDRLQGEVLEAERVQQSVLREVRRNRTILAWTPSVWPIKGRITSSFGMRNHPFDKKNRMHQGLDIAPRSGRGTAIHAPANGVVTFIGRRGYYGLVMEVRHREPFMTRYAHLNGVAVKVGDTVSRDDIIAYVGNTGRSTGPHLHYEVRVNGKAKNPRRYILN